MCRHLSIHSGEPAEECHCTGFVVVLFAVISHSDLIPGEYGSRIILLPFIPSDWTLHALWYVRRIDLPAHAALCRPGTAGTIHRHALCPRRRNACPCPRLTPVLDYIQNTSHTDMAVLLPRHVLPAVRFLLLADGRERQNQLVRYHQTCRYSNADLLYYPTSGMLSSNCRICDPSRRHWEAVYRGRPKSLGSRFRAGPACW